MMNAMMGKCSLAGHYMFLSLMISCERKETSTSTNVAASCQVDELYEGSEQKITAKNLGFEAALWLDRKSADSFEFRASAGNPTVVEGLRKTLAQLNYKHFTADPRIEGVIITRKSFRGDAESGKKIQIRHIPIVNGYANVGDQSPIYIAPEMLLKFIPLEEQ